jgi:multiple antibiotic resistance protein
MFSFHHFVSAFIVLFAIIDVFGSIPIFVSLRAGGQAFSPLRASLISFLILLGFFFAGDGVLRLFGVDTGSFAVAGSLVLFVIACEMTFGWEIFKFDSPSGSATIVPIVFPLLAGPGAFTALLSLKAEFTDVEIIAALLANMLCVLVVLTKLHWVERILGHGGIYVLRKFFGVILLAISVRLFMGNITSLPAVLGS